MKQKIGDSHVDKPDPDPAKIWCNILKLYESCVLVVRGGPSLTVISALFLISVFVCSPNPCPAACCCRPTSHVRAVDSYFSYAVPQGSGHTKRRT